MAATERVVVLMTKSQKTAVAERARAANLSVADFMRRSALGEDDPTLQALLLQVRRSTAAIHRAFRRVLPSLERARERAADREAEVARRAREEFTEAEAQRVVETLFGGGR